MTTVKFSASAHPIARAAPAYRYSNLWYRQSTKGPSRLVIGPSCGHVDVLLTLSRLLPEPFGVLYVLLVPRRGERKAGRYQSATPVSRPELEAFLGTYREFFERDGRHHVWVQAVCSPDLLVYDNHDVIYAYGSLDKFEETLRKQGMCEKEFRFPAPHTHHYNAEFDEDEAAVMTYWPWKWFPLQPGDDP